MKIILSNCLREDSTGNCVICDRNYVSVDGSCEKKECEGINNCTLCENRGTMNSCHLCDENMVLHSYNEKNTLKQQCVP